ncbi:MAG: hypothetical protein ABFS43_07390 [Thermodesulfobacteriota bacterium]
MVLIDFSTAAQEEINKRRQSLIKPINEQEAYVLAELREGYADLHRGTAALKAYLDATVDLVADRDAVLNQLGVLDDQQKIIKSATKLSDDAVDALETVDDVENGIDDFLETMEDIKKVINKLKKEED